MTIDPADLQRDAVELASALIRVDTSSPPGNETAAAMVLRDWLAARGIDAELTGPDTDRLNLVATVPGDGDASSLALSGHLDVVPAVAAEQWTHPPFSGHVDADGMLWGRGAVDMKQQVATRAVALAALVQSGARFRGTVRLIAQADEEANTADVGMSWLVRHRRDLRVDFAIEEGGGRRMTLADGRDIVTCGVGDKASNALRLTAIGVGGHGSLPGRADNPVLRLARLLAALAGGTPRRALVPAARDMLAAFAGPNADAPDVTADLTAVDEATIARLIDAAREQAPTTSAWLDAVTRITMSPTLIRASTDAINVIPAEASIDIDTRLLPGQTPEDGVAELHRLISAAGEPPDSFTINSLNPAPLGGAASRFDTEFAAACQASLDVVDPGATLVPTLNPFFTDAHHLRAGWGTVTYGLWPWKHTPHAIYDGGVHAIDERVHVDDLGHAAQWHVDIVRRWSVER